LSSFSSFFKEILLQDDHPKPYIYLKGISYPILQSILDYIYQGEVNVAKEELENFLSVTAELQIKGLVNKDGTQVGNTEEEEENDEIEEIYPKFVAPKNEQKILRSTRSSKIKREDFVDIDRNPIELKMEQVLSEEEFDDLEVPNTPEKPKRERRKNTEQLLDEEDIDSPEDPETPEKPKRGKKKKQKKKKKNNSLSDNLMQLIERNNDGRCRCIECDKIFCSYVGIRQHIDVVHNDLAASFECRQCQKVVKSKQKFRIHLNHGHQLKGRNIIETYGTLIE